MGLFFYTQKGSIISTVVLPTTEIIEPFLNRQNESGQKIILPLLHNITVEDLKAKYPDVGDIQCISTDKYSKDQVTVLLAKELIKRYK